MINVKFTADPLPADFKGDLQDFQNIFLTNLRGTIEDTQVLTGQVGGTMPTTNVGPWLNGQAWYVWNGSTYVPSAVRVGEAGYVIQLSSLTTTGVESTVVADYEQSLQDKDGVIALLSDVYEGRDAVVLTGTAPTIDWNLSNQFTETLSGNTTMKMANSLDGQEIRVALKNNATSWTVTWPSYVFWTGGVAPSQTASKTDLYIFYNIGGSIFGRQIANYS